MGSCQASDKITKKTKNWNMREFTKNIVIDYKVRHLCKMPYNGHSNGCPNYNTRIMCPPARPKIKDVFNITKGFWIIWNEFDINAHVEKMKSKHPSWSQRQLRCCLYWQTTARKQLEIEIQKCLLYLQNIRWIVAVARVPEAMGLDVTATMKNINVELEWPPFNIARQIAIIGYKRSNKKKQHVFRL
jgi:predicted metal-binding protein